MSIRNCFYIQNLNDTAVSWTLDKPYLKDLNYKYSLDNGVTWENVVSSQEINLAKDAKIYFKGGATPSTCRLDLVSWNFNKDWFCLSNLSSTDSLKLGGSLQSLIHDGDGDNHHLLRIDQINSIFVFAGIFAETNVQLDISDLKMNDQVGPAYYEKAFEKCLGLKSIPSKFLPSGFVTPQAYCEMFSGCKNLETMGENAIMATNISTAESCAAMFKDCIKLNKIYTNFMNWGFEGIGQYDSTFYWVDNVAKTGDFYCLANTEEKYGESNIPEGWTLHYNVTNKYALSV